VTGPVTEQAGAGFGGLLRRLRTDAGLTQDELAEAARVSQRAVSDLERGINRTARKDTAVLLAGALGLDGPARKSFVAAARGQIPAAKVLAAGTSGVTSRWRASRLGESTLLGRVRECAVVDGVLGRARAGASGVLLVVGTPGVGKSALLEYAVTSASDFQVVHAAGVESEMELAFAGLHQLCAPLLDDLAQLPDPQRLALETAFGLTAGVPPDPFFVGLGVLSLLSGAASDRPLLCVVDDVQWLDRASARALGFVARRLEADAVALLFAGREQAELTDVAGLTELRLEGLSDTDARALLASVLPRWVDEKVIEGVISETQGNPLALLELPRDMTPAELAAGFGLVDTLGLSGRIEESFRRRLEPLPEQTRRLVLLAAAEPLGDAALLWRACGLLGIDAEAVGPAEDADLVRVGAQVRFFHPLVRSAVYRSAAAEERRAAHAALAEATDASADPDRRAWHRAHAAAGPDEEVAAELERSAERARSRGGAAAAAAFLERSVALTLDSRRRSSRALAAARAWYEAGGYDAALELLTLAEAGPLDELAQARAEWLRAQIIYTRSDGRDGAIQLLRAAQRLEPLDRELARASYIDALHAATVSDTHIEVGRALRARPQSQPADATELLLRGYGVFYTDGFPHGTDILKQALGAFLAAPFTGVENIRTVQVAAGVALNLLDDAGFDVLSAQIVRLAREAGALSLLPRALDFRALYGIAAGELASAAAARDEAEAIREATGMERSLDGDLAALAALRDEEQVAVEHIEQLRRGPRIHDVGNQAAELDYSLAVLYNGLARYPEALAAAQRSRDRHFAGGFTQALAELVEAAVRCHEPEVAQTALKALVVRTRLGGNDWGLGVEAHSRASLAEGRAAEELYAEAIKRLKRTRMRLPLARAHLAYGEWLRRERRRSDARDQLRTAHDLFEAMGARSFAGRARHELSATGASAYTRQTSILDELTPQEARIASLANEGLSNAEIAARLYISASTVDYHLRKVFRKLGIRSRALLRSS
jgi:DNA-binding CsgD family transcriptional regulator/transcriptional regulator with XRE-family HTH domain